MRDGRGAKLGKGESKRGNKVVMGRWDWGSIGCVLGWGSPCLWQSWVKTEAGNEKLRDSIPVSRADDFSCPD